MISISTMIRELQNGCILSGGGPAASCSICSCLGTSINSFPSRLAFASHAIQHRSLAEPAFPVGVLISGEKSWRVDVRIDLAIITRYGSQSWRCSSESGVELGTESTSTRWVWFHPTRSSGCHPRRVCAGPCVAYTFVIPSRDPRRLPFRGEDNAVPMEPSKMFRLFSSIILQEDNSPR